MKNRFLTFLVVLAFLVFSFVTAFAGWVETDATGTKSYISDAKTRIHEEGDEGIDMIIDADAGTITMINRQEKTFASGTTDEYCTAFRHVREQEMAKLSSEERAMMQSMMDHLAGQTNKNVEITVESKGSGEKIAGHATERYIVFANGKKYEELWIAPDAEIVDKKTMKKYTRLMTEFSACVAASMGMENVQNAMPEMSKEYMSLMEKGWLMKSVTYQFGGAETDTEVKELRKQKVPDSEFQPPKGFKIISIEELLKMGAKNEE